MKKEKAAVTLFVIIIVMASVILGGVFIDFTRVLVAKNRVRTANESAVRSCLANYNEALVSDWGLFGVIYNDDLKNEYNKYINLNLSTDDGTPSLGILRYDNINTTLEATKDLGDSEVFQQKINEYSKYRAPVSLTLGVIDKFKSVFGGGNDADLDGDGKEDPEGTSNAGANAIESVELGNEMSQTADNVENAYNDIAGLNKNLFDPTTAKGYAKQFEV